MTLHERFVLIIEAASHRSAPSGPCAHCKAIADQLDQAVRAHRVEVIEHLGGTEIEWVWVDDEAVIADADTMPDDPTNATLVVFPKGDDE